MAVAAIPGENPFIGMRAASNMPRLPVALPTFWNVQWAPGEVLLGVMLENLALWQKAPRMLPQGDFSLYFSGWKGGKEK